MTRMKWTEQAVIAALRERQRQGLPTNRLHRDERRLHSAAVRRFSSIRAALAAVPSWLTTRLCRSSSIRIRRIESSVDMKEVISDTLAAMGQLFTEKNIEVEPARSVLVVQRGSERDGPRGAVDEKAVDDRLVADV